MPNKVELYVYDLSNGLARQMSLQLTGRQIDGIWHTSLVIFGKEHFYGQGICVTAPGQSHHGRPLQIIDIGETEIDEATWQEYLNEMRSLYTADKVTTTHLPDFNCNSFTNDCVGFLTGNSVPEWIKDLPSDFLSTPFGAALRPTIDAMFRRPTPGVVATPPTLQSSPVATSAPISASPDPALTASLLQAVASQALSQTMSSAIPAPAQATSTLTAPVHMCSNPSSMHSLLRSHRAVVAFFTSKTCPPCRMIEPVWDEIAREKTHGNGNASGIAFAKVDMGVGLGGQVGAEWGVRVTPTFLFFLDGKKFHELKGANAPELRTQVNLLLFEAFPPHKHTSLSLPSVEALSTSPILFTQVPTLDSVFAKLSSFLDASSPSHTQAAKDTLSTSLLPYLKARFPTASGSAKKPAIPPATPQQVSRWAEATRVIASALSPAQLFPLVDMWRLAVLDEAVGSWCATAAPTVNPVHIFLGHAIRALDEAQANARNYVLVFLRMLANAFASTTLARTVLSTGNLGNRAPTTKVLVSSLLHGDAAVRTAAASVAFNVAAFLQKGRVNALRGANIAATGNAEEDGEWEVELVSAVLEALSNEVQSEEVVHRLTAAVAFLLRLSPVYDTQLVPFLEVLQARDTLKSKLVKGGCGPEGVQKKDVRKLIEEVAVKLCP
ncbi:DUF862-domain-containing protein [Sparassis latifolia]